MLFELEFIHRVYITGGGRGVEMLGALVGDKQLEKTVGLVVGV